MAEILQRGALVIKSFTVCCVYLTLGISLMLAGCGGQVATFEPAETDFVVRVPSPANGQARVAAKITRGVVSSPSAAESMTRTPTRESLESAGEDRNARTPTAARNLAGVANQSETPARDPTSAPSAKSTATPTPTSEALQITIMNGQGRDDDKNFRNEFLAFPKVMWRSEGAGIVFSRGPFIYAVRSDGTQLRQLVDVGLNYPGRSGKLWDLQWPPAMFDLSQDGQTMVYATFEYPEPWTRKRSSGEERPLEVDAYSYEIARVHLDTMQRTRVTANQQYDLYPALSPDGNRIAYRQWFPRIRGRWQSVLRTIQADDGSTDNALAGNATNEGVETAFWHAAPVWSPNGYVIAFVAPNSESDTPWSIFLVHADGTGLRHLTTANSAPSWSPDGQRLAFARAEGGNMALYSMATDGTDARRIAIVDDWAEDWKGSLMGANSPTTGWVGTVAWSPDGSKILYTCGGSICVTTVDGTDVGRSLIIAKLIYTSSHTNSFIATSAAWSPDGSRVALLGVGDPLSHTDGQRILLYTMAPDGQDIRILVVEGGSDARQPVFLMQSTGAHDSPDYVGCASGRAVRNPAANPGLVADCEALLELRNALAGTAELDWSADRAIAEWEGIVLGGSPARVHRIDLIARGLTGVIPPGIGRVGQLRQLWLSGNYLGGVLPSTLGNLTQLREFHAVLNYLSGEIPRELGNSTQLTQLVLSENFLHGRIPAELGRLEHLGALFLNNNHLAGSIPPELGRLSALSELNLSHNELSGPIPTELGQLLALRRLDFHHNQLSGRIPAELGQLPNLEYLNLFENQLTGLTEARPAY